MPFDELDDITQILANRWWVRVARPFPHISATDVFVDSVYLAVESAFMNALDAGFSSRPAGGLHFMRNMGDYDAYGATFPYDIEGPLSIFTSRPWHDMIAGLVGIEATGDVSGGLHHHAAGSADGHIHNDLNPGWFGEARRPDGVNVADSRVCTYVTGEVRRANVTPREVVRAAAIIYYLANEPWKPGDGGETGLYWGPDDDLKRPVASIPPLNNSLVVFECTPHSYHAFLSNVARPRNAVVMWLHQSKDAVLRRWGEDQIVYW